MQQQSPQRRYKAERWVKYAERSTLIFASIFVAMGMPLILLATISPVGRFERIGFFLLCAACAGALMTVWWLLKQARTRVW